MTTEVTYTMVMNVTNSWDQLKALKAYEQRCGELIFTKLFDLAPEARYVYGFSLQEDFRLNPKYDVNAKAMVDMIDCAVAFLGPDLDPLTDHLIDLGRRHTKYGVKPEHLPVMGRAVIYALQEMLGSKFSLDDLRNWAAIFDLMVSKMLMGMMKC